MRIGNKKIFHLEAWVVKVMSLYKVCMIFRLGVSVFTCRVLRLYSVDHER